MNVVEGRIMKCIDESYLIDKKMRKRTFRYEKYIIPLNDNNPFKRDELVKIIHKKDFDTIGDMLKRARNDKEKLKKEIYELKMLLESQENYITTLENESKNKSFKSIIGL